MLQHDHRPPAERQEQERRQPRALPAPLQGPDPRGGASGMIAERSITRHGARAATSTFPAQGHHRAGLPPRHGRRPRDRSIPATRNSCAATSIARPEGGGGGGGGRASRRSGEGDDDFVFTLSREEFMKFFFDDLELPHLTRTQLAEAPKTRSACAPATSSDGTPTQPERGALACAALGAAHRARRRRSRKRELAREAAGSAPRSQARADRREIRSARGARSRTCERAPRARALPRRRRPALPQPRQPCRSRPRRR